MPEPPRVIDPARIPLQAEVTCAGVAAPAQQAGGAVWSWLAALIGWMCLIAFTGLGGGAGFEPTDAWVAQTAREMRASADWRGYVVPQFSGEVRLQKSPGPYWAVILASVLRGTPVDEVSARMPSAIAAVALCAMCFLFGRRIAGDRAGIFAGFVSGSSLAVLYWSHRAASDFVLAVLICASLLCFWLSSEGQRRAHSSIAWLLAGYLAAGLGMLCKMPVAPVCVGLVMLAYVVLQRRWRFLANPWHALGVVLFCLPWLPWVILAIQAEPMALQKWRGEYVDRFTGDLPSVESQQAWWSVLFYVPVVIAFCVPFAASIGPALFRALQPGAAANRRATHFLLIWFVSLLLFFTFAAGKETRYILPALPPLLLLLGLEMARFFDPARPIATKTRVAALLVCVLVAIGWVAGGWGIRAWFKIHGSAEGFSWPHVLGVYVATAAIFCLAVFVATWLFARGRRHASFATLTAGMWATWLFAWPNLMPLIGSERPYQDFARQMREKIPREYEGRVFDVSSHDARIIWYGELRLPRLVDQLKMLEMQSGKRSHESEVRIVATEMVKRLESDEPVLLIAPRPVYIDFMTLAPAELQKQGRAMPRTHLWFETSVGHKLRHYVAFGNRRPPWPEPELNPPSERMPAGRRAARPKRGAPLDAESASFCARSPRPGRFSPP